MSSTRYKTAVIDRVFFLRWEEPPTQEDTQAVFAEMQKVYETLKPPLILVASLSPKSPLPNSEQRRSLSNLQADARPLFVEMELIVEGNELHYNLQRVIISGIQIVTRTYDHAESFQRVLKRADDAAPHISGRLKVDGVRILTEARARGVI